MARDIRVEIEKQMKAQLMIMVFYYSVAKLKEENSPK